MHEPMRVQIGPTVKQYRRFHLKSHDVYRGQQEMPSFRYWITVENDGHTDDIGLILEENSTPPLFLAHLQDWLREQFIHIYRARQQLEELMKDSEVSDEMVQGQQHHIEDLQGRYSRAVQALREIEPSVRIDESIPEPLQDLNKEEDEI